MKKIGQKGFTLIEILLIIITLSVVAGVGYYIYSSNKNDSIDATTAGTTVTKSTATKQTTKYLTIEPLRIKIPLSDELTDMSYVVPQEGGEIVLTSKKLAALEDSACGTSNDPPSIGRIMSLHKESGTHKSTSTTEDFFIKQFDGFYIVGSFGNLGCGDSSESRAIKAYNDASQKLYEAANTATEKAQQL